MVTKQSFHHNLNYTSKQKTSLTKNISFDFRRNDKNIQSFGHNTVIRSQSKLHIKSKKSLAEVFTFDILKENM